MGPVVVPGWGVDPRGGAMGYGAVQDSIPWIESAACLKRFLQPNEDELFSFNLNLVFGVCELAPLQRGGRQRRRRGRMATRREGIVTTTTL